MEWDDIDVTGNNRKLPPSVTSVQDEKAPLLGRGRGHVCAMQFQWTGSCALHGQTMMPAITYMSDHEVHNILHVKP